MEDKIREFKIGSLEASLIQKDTFALDGGAMFGIVPKTLWSKVYDSDKQNRINLSGSILLVKTDDKNIIVETGIGSKFSEKEKKIFKIKNIKSSEEALSPFGLKPLDIDIVVLTHLHFDHAGGATKETDEGIEPTYKNAKYIVQKTEFKAARNPNERTQESYREEDFMPLEDSGNLKIIEGEREIQEGIRLIKTGGHTVGHQIVVLENEDQKYIHIGDLVPTSSHLPLPYIMGYDTHPLTTLNRRKKWYRRILEERMKVIFPHDIDNRIIGPQKISNVLD